MVQKNKNLNFFFDLFFFSGWSMVAHMNCINAKKSIVSTLRATLVACGLGALAVCVGLLVGSFDFVFFGALLAVLVPLAVCGFFVSPVWDIIDRMRVAGRRCLLAVSFAPAVAAIRATVFSFFRPPRLILG